MGVEIGKIGTAGILQVWAGAMALPQPMKDQSSPRGKRLGDCVLTSPGGLEHEIRKAGEKVTPGVSSSVGRTPDPDNVWRWQHGSLGEWRMADGTLLHGVQQSFTSEANSSGSECKGLTKGSILGLPMQSM